MMKYSGYTGYITNEHMPPCIVNYQGVLHLFFVEYKGKLIQHAYSKNLGISWDAHNTVEGGMFFVGTTSAGPWAVVEGDTLYVFYRDSAGNGIYQCSSTDGDTFQDNHYIGVNCDDQPHGVSTPDGLFLAYNLAKPVPVTVGAVPPPPPPVSTTTGEIYKISAGPQLGVVKTQVGQPPAIVYFAGQYFYFYKNPADGASELIYLYKSGADTDQWLPGDTGYMTSGSPCPVVDDKNILHVFYRDPDGNGVMHIRTSDGMNWETGSPAYIGINCRIQPSATLIDGTVCVACVDGDGKGIMYAAL